MAYNDPDHGKQELDHDPVPLKIYLGVLGSLAFLTFVTVWIAQFNFGAWNLPVAMAVAVAKASLVVLYFMNLKYDSRFNAVVFLTGFFFLIVFTIPTLWDRETRQSLDPARGTVVNHSRHGYPSQVTGVPAGEAAPEAAPAAEMPPAEAKAE